MIYSLLLACLFAVLALCSGCAADHTVRGMCRMGKALEKAALSPGTFVPLAAAGVVQYTGIDDDISEWASSRTLIFGSQENADKWSNITLGGTQAANLATLLAADDRPGVYGKLRRFAAGLAASELTYAVTGSMKTQSRRLRPDGSDYLSFPSGHAASAGVNAALTARNLRSAPAPYGGAPFLHAGVTSLSAATAWARVEAKKHYPTDVLFGAAMGNFIGVFVSGLLLDSSSMVNIQSDPERFAVQVRTEFE